MNFRFTTKKPNCIMCEAMKDENVVATHYCNHNHCKQYVCNKCQEEYHQFHPSVCLPTCTNKDNSHGIGHGFNAKKSNAKKSNAKKSNAKKSNAKKSNVKKSNAKKSNAKKSNAKKSNTKKKM